MVLDRTLTAFALLSLVFILSACGGSNGLQQDFKASLPVMGEIVFSN